jgi:hypothetical protein
MLLEAKAVNSTGLRENINFLVEKRYFKESVSSGENSILTLPVLFYSCLVA